jgi:alanine transaminase
MAKYCVAYARPFNALPCAAGKSPDWLYCHDLLQECGIVVVPGSGFGQADGTFHFRITLLPSEQDIGLVMDRLASFHAGFMARFGPMHISGRAAEPAGVPA